MRSKFIRITPLLRLLVLGALIGSLAGCDSGTGSASNGKNQDESDGCAGTTCTDNNNKPDGANGIFTAHGVAGGTTQILATPLGAFAGLTPAPVSIRFERGSISGSVYYWDIAAGRIVRINDGSAVRDEFMPHPPKDRANEYCVGCHAVSNSGRYVATQSSSFLTQQTHVYLCSHRSIVSAIYRMRTDGTERVRLDNASGGPQGTESFQPRLSPFETENYFWLSYLSRRDYGNAEAGTKGSGRQQIWVSAVAKHPTPGEDPSEVGFWLPGQSTQSMNIAARPLPRGRRHVQRRRRLLAGTPRASIISAPRRFRRSAATSANRAASRAPAATG